MLAVTRDQFRIRSEVEIVHLPTGATFSTYPYNDPADMLGRMTAQWGQAEKPSGDTGGYARQDIGRVARELLLEQARRVARTRS